MLEAVAVAWVGLATYAVQDLAGLWPDGASDSGQIHSGLTTIAVVGIAAALVLLGSAPTRCSSCRSPPAPHSSPSTWPSSSSATKIDDLSPRQTVSFLLPLGLAWIATGLWLDVTRRRSYATWAHWVGLVVTGIGGDRDRAEDGAGLRADRCPRCARTVLLGLRAALELHRHRRRRRPHWP